MKERLPRRFWAAIVGLTALGAALTLGVSVHYWAAPWMPLAAFVAFGISPIAFSTLLSALVFDPRKTSDALVSKDSPGVGRRLMMSLAPLVVGAVVFGAVVAAWFSPDARVVAVEFAGSQRLQQPLERALRDRSGDVRLAACEQLGEMSVAVPSRALLNRLDDPNEAVLDCALRALPSASPGTAPGVLRLVTSQWYDAAMTEEEGDVACIYAERIKAAGRAGVGSASMRLMQCALDAQSAPARQCCGQSFRGMLSGGDVEPYMVMPPVEALARTSFVSQIPTLLEASFADGPEAEQRRQALQLGSARSNAWALALSCEALTESSAEYRTPISTSVAHHVSTDACQLAPATERTVRLWSAICSGVVPPESVDGADGTEPERLCVGVNAAIGLDAVNEARHQVDVAVRIGTQPDRRAAVIAKLLDYSAHNPQQSRGAQGAAVDESRGDGEPTMSNEMMKILDYAIGENGPGERHVRRAFEMLVTGETPKSVMESSDPQP